MAKLLTIQCTECGSERLYKAGLRYLKDGYTVQRWLCRNCGYRFSEPKVKVNVSIQSLKSLNSESDFLDLDITKRNFPIKERCDSLSFQRRKHVTSHTSSKGTITEKVLNTFGDYNRECQVCDSERRSKNLIATEQKQTVAGDLQKTTQQDVKGKIVEYGFYMQKQGYSESTIRLNMTALKVLAKRGANLLDPESVKEVITKQKWSEARKRNVINAYSLFLKLNGVQWEKPKCKVTRKFPFIPTEQEIDALISGSGKKTSTFLQLLKETAMRSGEAKRVEWINIDFQKNIVTLNLPEKGSNPRMWRVSQKLIGMLNALPRESQKVFGESLISSMRTTFLKSRKRLATKLQNPRLNRISFHTIRHWKATYEYHRTKDPYYVKQFLGHKSLKSTEIYINIERTLFEPGSDEFTVKVTDKPEKVKALLEVGFEYVCKKDELIFLRKRK